MKEKRQHIRFPSNRPIVMFLGDRHIYATMTDFSRHGVGFISSSHPEVDSNIEVHFDIVSPIENNRLHQFQFKGTVKHCITYSQNSHIGVRLEVNDQDYFDIFDALHDIKDHQTALYTDPRMVNL
ncbi:PilZ domain-containing protein [Thiomicrorhabdus sediminis]|uniref:PilZ domain-containing protein n=1 Tax=Thiomicrorhabdus sediminis TaxID=2580412 RepID=A0A4P9K310_9GAMM|nr:PilZ domain-containing protein [Thiomicrorhabdus sediminis]QCU89244.1 PilZ domain-containing protein [Thiomicrorhabdus sediminis]